MDRAAIEDFASLSRAKLIALSADVQSQRAAIAEQPRWSAGESTLADVAFAIDQLARAIASSPTSHE